MKPVTTDTWQVTYTDCIGATEAPADGSVGKWKEEGYFVAHCHMAGGKEILAQHEYVIVDGKRYKLVSTKIIGRKYTQEVRDYAYANQGIVFQTCYGNNENLLVHYKSC